MNELLQNDIPACCRQCLHFAAESGCDFGLMLPKKKQQCKRMESVNVQTKGMTGMIQMINVEKLSPHKDNPRKDLGDISELAESIKSAGILQNLTVVPYIGEVNGEPIEGLYKVVIGHRRLAAAKLAGLTEVPCTISNMTYKEQIATMLLENMQRSDLTIYEQAEGFQMMLDLGESVNDISHKTGFSDTTVRRRVKLLELDKDKFKKSVERGATLMDYVELEKIKDVELRNQVLDKIGTSNFNWELRNALDKQKRDDNKALIIAELEKFATLITNNAGMQFVEHYYPSEKFNFKAPEDIESVQYYFTVPEYGPVTLFKKLDADEIESSNTKFAAKQAKRDELAQSRKALDELAKQAYQLRRQFVKEISNSTAKKYLNTIIYYLHTGLDDACLPDLEDYCEFLDIVINDEEEYSFDLIKDRVTAQPELHLLTLAYLTMDSSNYSYHSWNARYEQNDELDMVYDFLIQIGYEMSDAEICLRNGTHSLFIKESEEAK